MYLKQIEGVGEHSVVYQPISPLPWQLRADVEYFEILSRVSHPGGWNWHLEELFSCPHRTLAVDLSTLDHAAHALRENPDMRFGVNASPTTLFSGAYMEALEFVAAHMEKPSRLVVEVTERFSAEDGTILKLISALERVHSFGVQVALDDFGTGGAGLAAFSMFHFDYVKFAPIVDVTHERGRAVFEAVVNTANKTGDFTVVLEGVESQDILNVANEVGAFYAQGYHIARPSKTPKQPPAMTIEHDMDEELTEALLLHGS